MDRTRYRSVSLIALCLAMLLGSAGLQPAAAQDAVELRVWDQFTDPEDSAAVDAIYADFTEQNPNITITREVFSTDQMRQTVNTAIASGTGPDIIFYDAGPGYAGVLAEAGLLAPLDDLSSQYGWADRIAPNSMEATTLNGQLFGLPLQVDLIGMYYNQTLLDQEGLTVPQNFADMLTFCQQASEKGYVPLAFTNNPGWEAFHQFSMVVTNMIGPDALRSLLQDNQGRWDSPEVVAAIDAYFVQMRDAGCFSEDVNALTYDDATAMFQSGQALLHPTGSWLASDLSPESMPDMDVRFMPFPELEGGQGAYWVSGVGSAYYITSKTEHQAEAGQFLDYLFSPEVAQRWVSEARFFVPMSVDTTGMELDPLFQSVLTELDKASKGEIQFGYNIDVMAPPEFNDAMLNGFQAILAGDKTPDEVAAELQAAWDAGYKANPEASPAA
jgi:raffinose/stachyose/melibiose transport system substrate-binding protein